MGLRAISEEGLELIGRFYSSYLGLVIDNQDVSNTGMLKVLIPSINGGYVCWALNKESLGRPNSGLKRPIPQVEDYVWVSFELGDLSSPYWNYCGWLTSDSVPEELKPLNSFGFITPKGNKVYINDDTGDIFVNVQGNINIDSAKQVIFNQGQNFGMVKIQELTAKINNLVQELETLRNAFNAHTHPGVQSGPGTTSPTVNQVTQPFSQFNKDDYENTKILQ